MREQTGEVVELRVEATLAQLPLVRTMSTAVAMRRDFDMESIADLRLVVDEACSLLVARALPFGSLGVRYRVTDEDVHVRCVVPVLDDTPLECGGLGWTLLAALTESVATGVSEGDVFAEMCIELRLSRRATAA
ncbi:ATP-binding protein [Actinokineospora enzanensis]|uniref:ATP-binding protein n=1 Tax=Actinokineospora enzanensis TaxID=155975 RepID=UPI0003808DC5|nr:ATP-binding protein [Actinokineospora enzanensis]